MRTRDDYRDIYYGTPSEARRPIFACGTSKGAFADGDVDLLTSPCSDALEMTGKPWLITTRLHASSCLVPV
ncbi:hypothetical protein EVAR_60797_1 [Eumeta japonica]|uniref:Uncharacterized protein n=1 Tax=Eumeta variegata TaxID=151549 RepID=A0A4C1YJE4_EUMVA|nr:hypothetical protein EVAR_60797_1 [Eumeta japonica]